MSDEWARRRALITYLGAVALTSVAYIAAFQNAAILAPQISGTASTGGIPSSSAVAGTALAAVLLILILPPLGVLGFIFCLVYERTGSLYPVIALHALNNSIAYGVTVEDASVSLVLGPLMLLACATIPRAQRVSMA